MILLVLAAGGIRPQPPHLVFCHVDWCQCSAIGVWYIWGRGQLPSTKSTAQHTVKILRLNALGTADAVAPSLNAGHRLNTRFYLNVEPSSGGLGPPPGGVKQCGRQLSFLCFCFCFPRPPPSFSSGNNMMESDQTGRRQDKAPHFNSIKRRAVPTKPEKSICDFQPPVPASPPTGRGWAGLSLFSFLPLTHLPHDHT